jgi:integrating conjugative element protein (TIGR03761 family)
MTADNPLSPQKTPPRAERSNPSDKPGALHGQVWLTVQTNQAQQLIHGRDGTSHKPTIIGLVGFANRLRVIWQAARSDDPYAHWWLIKVHEAIEMAGITIGRQQARLVKQLEQMMAMEVSVAASQRPYRVQLQFANPYAYRGAQLLAAFDTLVCTAFTARHLGLLDGEACGHVHRACAHQLRALFMLPQRYRFLKLDRASVRLQTGRSHEARKIMGEIPDDVLSGKRQAPLVPRKVKFPAGVAGHRDVHPGSPASDTMLPEDKNSDG